MEIEVVTDNFAKFVKIISFVDGYDLSDNYFDLMPEERKILTVTSGTEKFPEENNIKVFAINSNL